jgi:hypothetical protein
MKKRAICMGIGVILGLFIGSFVYIVYSPQGITGNVIQEGGNPVGFVFGSIFAFLGAVILGILGLIVGGFFKDN